MLRIQPENTSTSEPIDLIVIPTTLASGLHRPNGLAFDPERTRYFFADQGRTAFEEINAFDPAAAGILNYGWPLMEGTAALQDPLPMGLIPPVAQYARGSGAGQGSAVIGGQVYSGGIEALQGEYFFADAATGKIWSIAAAQAMIGSTLNNSAFLDWTTLLRPNEGTLDQISGFGSDCAGNLLITDNDGDVFRVTAA